MRLDGSSALVAGGASGLGAATAIALAEAGAQVVVLDLPPAVETARLPSTMRLVAGDVLDSEAVARAVALAGELRVAVSCAGIATPGRLLGRDGPLALEDFERVLRVNATGTLNVLRLAAASVAEREPVDGERGVLVTTASVAAFEGQIGQAAYAASKGAVAALTLPLARELASALIRVVSIAPGTFDTPLLSALPERSRMALGSATPHPARLGRPEEFAALVRHIVENPMLNGEVIRLDGALRMPPR
ncbi:SDR family NAD(P)-dependent oxidoreductase [Rathayibacter tanaceti]|uniref:3-oxoacyl-[acyl-carrier-protein] reductase FabG n=2 Tax=Rathayibacter tanaceti TaxID=1671680 RepID=A0A166HYE0_9MICO|nr:SDR family NAD(P)-dependent oxidoreductase [Rathayibacter tanaceti]KZX21345.1 3-oxoacyl-[acyl-carrier-protein] reductase FabG [Rathayibacter tanaceti]QHC54929.1 SDR family NAD(P)-dependent oxidoreductase [Rathayibacter tanaceti]TCO38469.1 NAD(P)-dependent dehydrogenase (short-subunit alcohol dehydrogenase family) [Rathayibacter tanaceti]